MDGIHELDGHDVNVQPVDRDGEERLMGDLSSLYAQHGVEYAADDASGADSIMLQYTKVEASRWTTSAI